MEASSSRLLLLLGLFAALLFVVKAGTCDPESSPLTLLFKTPTAQFSYKGASILVEPWRKYGVVDTSLNMRLDMSRFAEVQSTKLGCYSPGIIINDQDVPVTRELLISECDCSFTKRNLTLEGQNWEESVKIDVDCSQVNGGLFEDFALQIYFKRPHLNYSYTYEPRISTQNKTITTGYTYVFDNFLLLLISLRNPAIAAALCFKYNPYRFHLFICCLLAIFASQRTIISY